MKMMRLFCMVVGAGALLLSCYLPSPRASGKIVLTAASQAKTISAGSNLVRVSLFSVKDVNGTWVGQSLYTFSGGQTYVQGNVGSTLTLDNVPTGTWAVLVSAGYTDPVTGNFVITDYNFPYTKSIVSVAPGVDNPVTVNLNQTAPAPSFFGTMQGVANVNGTIYAVSSTQLYTVSGTTATPVPGGALPGGVSANSVNAGYYYYLSLTGGPQPQPTPYVNTNAGIYYLIGGNIQSDLAASNPIPILASAAFTSSGDIALFYGSATGFGGAWLNSSSYSSSMWVNFKTSGTIAGQPLYDFTVSSAYAYFASKFGAFQSPQSVVQGQSAADNILASAHFFSVPDDSTILSLNYLSTGANGFFIGSTTGAWSATLNETATPPVTGQTRIAATAGDSIIKIASMAGYVAFLSQYNLYLYNTSTQAVKVYPFYSGLPGQLTAMAWGAGPTLYITGAADASVGSPGGLVTISGAGLP